MSVVEPEGVRWHGGVQGQADLDAIAAKLNHRPPRVLGWATPAEASAALGLPEPRRSQLG